MRIEMFMPGLSPAALGARVHQDFAAAVRALGHEFRIVTTAVAGGAATGDVLPTSPAWQMADRLAAPWLRTRSVLSPAAALAGYLRREGSRIDVLHVEVAYPFGTAAWMAMARARWHGPLVITPMGEDTLVHEPSQYGFRRHPVPRWLVGQTLRRARGLRCISPMHERAIAAIAPDTPRRVVPLNVTAAVMAAAAEAPEARVTRRLAARAAIESEWPVANRPLVLSLGRLHPFKGLDVLVQAMTALPDAVLLIAGPSLTLRRTGDEAARLRGLIMSAGLQDRVWVTGPVPPDRAPVLLAASDVVAVPSRTESLNKVCVESAAVGTPFVVTATTGVAEWASKTGVGVVVPPADPAALAAGIRMALGRRLSPDAVRTFTAPFDPARVAVELCNFYRQLLASPR